MKFIINNKIVFDINDSKIELLGDTIEPITLSATLCRVLSLLVKNNDLLLSREFILSSAWDEYGKTSSHSNLNNYISMLRKIFSSLGESNIIVTVPREGFMFKASEVHTLDGERLPFTPASVDFATVSETVVTIEPDAKIEKDEKNISKWVIASTVTLLVGIFLLCTFLFSSNYKAADQTLLGNIDNCKINVLTTSKIAKKKLEIQEISRLVDKLGLDCSSPSIIYHFNTGTSSSQADLGHAISFLSYCPNSRLSGLEAKCENFYEVISKVK